MGKTENAKFSKQNVSKRGNNIAGNRPFHPFSTLSLHFFRLFLPATRDKNF